MHKDVLSLTVDLSIEHMTLNRRCFKVDSMICACYVQAITMSVRDTEVKYAKGTLHFL